MLYKHINFLLHNPKFRECCRIHQ